MTISWGEGIQWRGGIVYVDVMGRLWTICYCIAVQYRCFGVLFSILFISIGFFRGGWWNWFGKHHLHIWNLTPLCLMWTVWRERNTRTFEDATSSPDQLFGIFVNSLFDWLRIWGFTTAKTVTDVVVSLHSAYSPINML